MAAVLQAWSSWVFRVDIIIDVFCIDMTLLGMVNNNASRNLMLHVKAEFQPLSPFLSSSVNFDGNTDNEFGFCDLESVYFSNNLFFVTIFFSSTLCAPLFPSVKFKNFCQIRISEPHLHQKRELVRIF